MFGSVRARSLKSPVCSLFVRASERDRTRANAQPCHSCHGSSGMRHARRGYFADARTEPGGDLVAVVGRDLAIR
jgi:hypothetical protein